MFFDGSLATSKLWLYADLKRAALGVSALCTVVFKRIPALSVYCILLLMASQLCKMAAFLIPLKALYLAGNSGVPSYVSSVTGAFGKLEVVVGLSLVSVGLYLLHLIIDFVRGRIGLVAVKKLMLNSLEQQEGGSGQVLRAFEQSVVVLSSLVFSCILIFVLSLTVDWLTPLLVLYFAVMFYAYAIYYQHVADKREAIAKQAVFTVGVFSALGFLSGFALILTNVFRGNISSVLLAVLALVLLRLLMNQVVGGFKAAFALSKSHTHYSWLLSGGTPKKKRTADEELFFSLSSGLVSIPKVMQAAGLSKAEKVSYKWLDSGVRGVAKLVVRPDASDEFLLKIYAKSLQSTSVKESVALEFLSIDTLAPKVLKEFCFEGHSIRVFEPASDLTITAAEVRNARSVFLSKLMSTKPKDSLLSLAKKIQKPVHRRIDLLEVVAFFDLGGSLNRSAADLSAQWSSVQQRLDHSPKQLVVRVAAGTLGALRNELIVCNHWEQWSIEPVGAIWEGANIPSSMNELRETALRSRSDLSTVPLAQLQLVHALCRLEAAKARQRLSTCEDAVLQIVALIDSLEDGTDAGLS